jgi:cytosine/adenosine deaminase-related metal-dependent hydrolase
VFVGDHYDGPVGRRIDAGGMLVCPGFINTHVHIGVEVMTALIDIDRSGPGRWLAPRLATVASPLRSPLTEDEQRVSFTFALSRLLKSGCTTVVDVVGSGTLWWLGGPPEDVSVLAETAGRLGVRAYVSPGYRSEALYADEHGRPRSHPVAGGWRDELERAARFIEQMDGAHGGRIRGMLYPHATFNCSPELLRETRRVADRLGVGIQIHTASRVSEIEMLKERFGKTPIELLDESGCLGPHLLLGHCVFIDSHSRVRGAGRDLPRIAASGASVAHSPRPFARQGVALESFQRYEDAGVNMTIGTDIWPLDIISEMRLASLLCKTVDGSAVAAPAERLLAAATVGAARALGRDDLGRLTPGARADLVLIDVARSSGIGPVNDPIKGLLAAGSAADVDTVIVDGRTLVERKRLVGVDEERLREDAEGVAARFRAAAAERSWSGRPAEALFPAAFPDPE